MLRILQHIINDTILDDMNSLGYMMMQLLTEIDRLVGRTGDLSPNQYKFNCPGAVH